MKKNIIVYALATLLLVTSLFTLVSVKASGSNPVISKQNVQAEKEYVKALKEVLKSNSLPNAGITLTKTSDGYTTEYTVSIHTGEENSEELLNELNAIDSKIEGSTVYINLS